MTQGMELVNLRQLYTVRRLILRGRVNTMTLSQINALINKGETTEFISTLEREKIEEAIRAANPETIRGNRTLH